MKKSFNGILFLIVDPVHEISEIEDMDRWKLISTSNGGARGVVVIVVGNEHGDSSSNPGRD